MDSEVVNVIIAVAVIYFVVKWATGGSSSSGNNPTDANTARLLGFRPKNVTPEMVASVRSAFPDIPYENVHYDLLRTGSVEATVNRLLEKGFLEAPPAAYRRAFPPTTNAATTSSSTTPAQKQPTPNAPSLIERFRLESKVKDTSTSTDNPVWDGTGPIPSAAKGKGRVEPNIGVPANGTGAGVWEATAERRQESLQKRKEAMILAARKRLLEKQAKEKPTTQ